MFEFLTVGQAAELLGLKPVGIRRAISDGRLSATKHGRAWAIRKEDAETYTSKKRKPGRKPKAKYNVLQERVDFLTTANISTLSEDIIQKCLDDIISDSDFIMINYHLHAGYYVIRVRLDFDFNDIRDINGLSYKPAHLNLTYQRSSTPLNTMLYCSSCERREQWTLYPYTDVEFGLQVALYETIDTLRDNIYCSFDSANSKPMNLRTNINFIRNVTYSIWVVTEKLNLIRVAPYKEYDFQMYQQQILGLTFDDLINRSISEGRYIDAPSNIKFYKYLTEEFSKCPKHNDEKQYIISAQASKILCEAKNGGDGIAYPSVRCDGAGINFAIIPRVVDEGKIRCVEVGSFQLVCHENKLSFENIITHLQYPLDNNSTEPPLLELCIQNNKIGKKMMIDRQYSFLKHDFFNAMTRLLTNIQYP